MADDASAALIAVPVQSTAVTPMEMLSRALERGADLTVLEKLMDLQERHEKNLARKAFDAAVSDAKAEIPVIKKNRTGHNNKMYADFSAYAKVIDPILAKHGLSYRFRTKQETAIYVTCIVSHRDGHSEETTLMGGADNTGNKNSIQAIGSTLSYLQRYSLCASLGLAAAEDDDGASADGDEPITDEQRDELQRLLEANGGDVEKFCSYIKVDALSDIRRDKFEDAKKIIVTKAKAKKPKDAQ